MFSFLSQTLTDRQQKQRITDLEKKIELLEKQNDSMKQGMRRCITCEYRTEYKNNKQGESRPTNNSIL